MKYVRQFSTLLFIIAIPVALVTTNIRVAVNEPRLYEYVTDRYDTTETTGIARSELLRASGELRDYFNNDAKTIFIRVQKDGAPISLFNERETLHMEDVKVLFQTVFRVQEAAVLFVLAYIVAVFIWAREGRTRTLAKQIVLSGLISGSVIVALGVAVISGFHAVSDRFHVIAFSNDFWQLDPRRDHLIQMFPEAFWEDITLLITLVTLAEVAVLAGVAALYIRTSGRWEDEGESLSDSEPPGEEASDEERGPSAGPAQPEAQAAVLKEERGPSAGPAQPEAQGADSKEERGPSAGPAQPEVQAADSKEERVPSAAPAQPEAQAAVRKEERRPSAGPAQPEAQAAIPKEEQP